MRQKICYFLRWVGEHSSDLIYTQVCVGCGYWDCRLCPQCATKITEKTPNWELSDLGDLEEENEVPVWSIGRYEGVLRRFVLGAKHQEKAYYGDFLYQCGKNIGRAISQSKIALSAGEKNIWVIPAPSGIKRRWKGRMISHDIACGIAEGIFECRGGNVRVIDCLKLKWGFSTQAGKSREERNSGRYGTMKCSLKNTAHASVILVDDVMTSGATLREMRRVCPGKICAIAVLAQASIM